MPPSDHQHGSACGHAHVPAGSDRKLIGAIALNVLLTVAQVVGGIISGSLALLADALHNLSDAASLVVALVARRIARRPPDQLRTFGYRRAEVIGAVINLTALIVVALYLVIEAAMRMLDQQPIDGWIVVWVASIALIVDLGTAALTYAQAKDSINIRAAFLHNLTDALASVAVIVSGALILEFEAYWADLVATVLISLYVLYHGAGMMRTSVRILLESVPADLSLAEVSAALEALPGICDAHHVHVWQLDETHRALEAHIVLEREAVDAPATKAAARAMLMDRFRIGHTTLELELLGEGMDCSPDDSLPACFDQSPAQAHT